MSGSCSPSPVSAWGLDRFAHDAITGEYQAWLVSLPLTLEIGDRVLALTSHRPTT
jgi:hypothetical protein